MSNFFLFIYVWFWIACIFLTWLFRRSFLLKVVVQKVHWSLILLCTVLMWRFLFVLFSNDISHWSQGNSFFLFPCIHEIWSFKFLGQFVLNEQIVHLNFWDFLCFPSIWMFSVTLSSNEAKHSFGASVNKKIFIPKLFFGFVWIKENNTLRECF